MARNISKKERIYLTCGLFHAVGKNHLSEVKELVKLGANLDAKLGSSKEDLKKARGDYTLLHCAATSKIEDSEIVRYLVSNGADVNAKCTSGLTPLMNAAWNGNFVIIQVLVKKGAKINAKDEGGRTPLHYAAEGGRIWPTEYLIKKGAVVDAQDKFGNTPLHLAASKLDEDIIITLMANGADANIKNKRGCTPYDLALQNSDKVKQLLKESLKELKKRKGRG